MLLLGYACWRQTFCLLAKGIGKVKLFLVLSLIIWNLANCFLFLNLSIMFWELKWKFSSKCSVLLLFNSNVQIPLREKDKHSSFEEYIEMGWNLLCQTQIFLQSCAEKSLLFSGDEVEKMLYDKSELSGQSPGCFRFFKEHFSLKSINSWSSSDAISRTSLSLCCERENLGIREKVV